MVIFQIIGVYLIRKYPTCKFPDSEPQDYKNMLFSEKPIFFIEPPLSDEDWCNWLEHASELTRPLKMI